MASQGAWEVVSADQIAEILGQAHPGVAAKVSDRLDATSRDFILHSPLVLVSTVDAAGRLDVSPKGDAPGFCHVADDRTLLLPDRKGNNLAFGFRNILETRRIPLEQEKRVTQQIVELVKLARDEGELVGEQFLHWFLQEQREEVASMTDLLAVVERGRDNLLTVEEYLSRSAGGENPLEAGAPPAAGGAL